MNETVYNPNPVTLQPTVDLQVIMDHYKASVVIIDRPPTSARRVKIYCFEEVLKGHALIYMRDQWNSNTVESAARTWAYRRRLTENDIAYQQRKPPIADKDKFDVAVHKLPDMTVVVCSSIQDRVALPTSRRARWEPPRYLPAWCGMSGPILNHEQAAAEIDRRLAALAKENAEREELGLPKVAAMPSENSDE